MHRRLAPACSQVEHRLRHLGRRAQARHHLHQLHQRHRVEEVHAHEPLGPLHAARQGRDRDRRGIGRDDGLVGQQRLQLGEERALHVQVLDDGLDDEVGRLQRRHRLDARQRRSHGLGAELALGDQAVERGGQLGLGGLGRAVAGVEQRDLMAGLGGHLRNAGAHQAGADDEDVGGVEVHSEAFQFGLRLPRKAAKPSRASGVLRTRAMVSAVSSRTSAVTGPGASWA
mmetsp:Transcript_6672/g.27854  ORF Transcript_6672/g.27854 Transcript_6672/m.27854 type:complete len:228 (+) Transcript_6672:1789-2472(+)